MSTTMAVQSETLTHAMRPATLVPTSTSSSASATTSASTSAIGNKTKRSRASRPKVKTGCQTCKIRRVKCDEAKPSCMRCLRFGHQCDGYPNLPSARKLSCTSTNRRTLVPKQSPSSAVLAPSVAQFADGPERQRFQVFSERTRPAHGNTEHWQMLLERACQDVPAIRETVLLVGRSDHRPDGPAVGGEVGTLKHFASFRLFGKSSFYVQRGNYEVRSTCFATLLHYFGGIEVDAEERSVCTGFRKLQVWCSQHALAEFANEEAFDMLELSNLADADGRNGRRHATLRDHGHTRVSQMTDQFRDVAEAREMLELVLARSTHGLASGMHMLDFGDSPRDRKRGKMFLNIQDRSNEQASMVEEYHKWEAACRPLLEECRSMKLIMRKEYTELLTLRLLWLSGYLTCASHSLSGNFRHARFRLELKEMLEITSTLMQQSSSQASTPVLDQSDCDGGVWWGKPSNYVDFDVRSIISLMSLAWTYRHRGLRKIAVALLLAGPGQEGIYEGVLLGKMMAWLIALEEHGLADDDAFVPQESAAKMVKFALDADARRVEVSCLVQIEGDVVRKEALISW